MSASDNRGWQPDPPERDDAGSYQLAYPFLDQSTSFALGFEAGGVAARMALRYKVFSRTVHEANVDQLLLAAKHYGYLMTTTTRTSDGWRVVSFVRVAPI